MDRLTEIEKRWAKTTPGPWAVNDRFNNAGDLYVGKKDAGYDWFAIVMFAHDGWVKEVKENAIAIAAGPDDIAWLIAEIRRLQLDLREWREGLRGHT